MIPLNRQDVTNCYMLCEGKLTFDLVFDQLLMFVRIRMMLIWEPLFIVLDRREVIIL